ncbi:hypothetical protein TVAG_146030 [Trichomonas vaginalis G3]|uniref:Uncharacterized protein n=1 Tax=Trichomonas vaginalis (strain ATCC PRA-98 / G3) TaxID=412133 RepID=A2F8A6_TRIV3|nr:hypothetical protein TVAGG3_0038610 [Trichomonas vaginalis G3]EAX98866.1 hypothetical protein TVAG_146030 [Trichomonas vaginalis G3]KAI5540556.1 hypothetical protein TVAGG3_0038610 [Trichomonas vaginalis G3]|eukprot:XP_001311796.1 hypothetical protein [Trichomonas vaginalis G3]
MDTAKNITIDEFRKISANLRKNASEVAKERQLQRQIKNKKTSQCPAQLNAEQPPFNQVIYPVTNGQPQEGGYPQKISDSYHFENPLNISPQIPDFSNPGDDYPDLGFDPFDFPLPF